VNGRGTAGGNRQYSTVGCEKYRNNGCGARDEEASTILYTYVRMYIVYLHGYTVHGNSHDTRRRSIQ